MCSPITTESYTHSLTFHLAFSSCVICSHCVILIKGNHNSGNSRLSQLFFYDSALMDISEDGGVCAYKDKSVALM